MLRTILAVLVGLVVAVLTMLASEYIGMSLFPPPPGTQLDTEADLARLIASASTGKLAWVLFGWTLAAFIGGWVASRISRRHRIAAAVSVGVFIVVGVVLNVSMLPHPLWVTIAGVLLPIPAAWSAARIGPSRSSA